METDTPTITIEQILEKALPKFTSQNEKSIKEIVKEELASFEEAFVSVKKYEKLEEKFNTTHADLNRLGNEYNSLVKKFNVVVDEVRSVGGSQLEKAGALKGAKAEEFKITLLG